MFTKEKFNMDNKEINNLITAFVDNELDNKDKVKELQNLIEKDPDLKFEFEVQSFMKFMIKDRCKFYSTPEKVKKEIIRKISNEFAADYRSYIKNIFSRPIIAYGTIGAIILAVVLLIFNRPPIVGYYDFAIEQRGTDNMFSQAKNNFNSILEGKLKLQLLTSNPDKIKEFFDKNGVKYSTVVPDFEEYNLLGAVVSEDKGEKFAHLVYTVSEGKIIYLFQVDEAYIYSNEIISLSDDLLNYLDKGNCYETSENNITILMTKADNNILAVVSNIFPKKLKEDFCKIN